MPDKDRERALLRAVELYYYEGLTQAAISERLGRTRWTVGRLLKEASDTGIVNITIDHPRARRHDLELRLVELFGLRAARVVPTQSTQPDTLTILAQAAADYLADLRPRPQVVSLAGGRTTSAVIMALPEPWNSGVTVAQMCPAPRELKESILNGSLRTMARRGRGVARSLPSRLYANSPAAADRIRQDPAVATPLSLGANADVALFSPGDLRARSWLVNSGEISGAQLQQLRDRRAVATIGNRPVNIEGIEVDADLQALTIGATLDDIRRIRTSIAVGCCPQQQEGFAAIINGHLANVLVIDSDMADYLITNAL